jgi:hypothetical protein
MGCGSVTARSGRPDISMTPHEIAAFLAGQTRVIVVALDQGAPIGTIAGARFVDNMLEVRLRDGDRVRELLDADARVCVIAEQFPTYYEIKGVVIHGTARFSSAKDRTFWLPLDDITSFDFGKLPRAGAGSGKISGNRQ